MPQRRRTEAHAGTFPEKIPPGDFESVDGFWDRNRTILVRGLFVAEGFVEIQHQTGHKSVCGKIGIGP